MFNSTGAGKKYVYEDNNITPISDVLEWSELHADNEGTVPATLGRVPTQFMNALLTHSLNWPCCGQSNSGGGDARHANNNTGSSTGATANSAAIQGIRVYPNPANTVLNFEFPLSGTCIVKLLDITGRITDEQIVQNGSIATFNVQNYAPGIYLYQVVTGTTTQTGKVLIGK